MISHTKGGGGGGYGIHNRVNCKKNPMILYAKGAGDTNSEIAFKRGSLYVILVLFE